MLASWLSLWRSIILLSTEGKQLLDFIGRLIDGNAFNFNVFAENQDVIDEKPNTIIIATGGRVLSVTSKNKNFNIAKKKVYKVVRRLKWKNSFFRKDIWYRAKKLK